MERLNNLDIAATLAINGWHCAWLDPVMIFLSKVYVWVPLYLAVFIWYFFKLDHRKALAGVLILIAAFAFTDIFTHWLKEHVFFRLRPCEDPIVGTVIRALEGQGSLYGFPSGHAANTFCFAFISSWLAKRRWWTPIIFIWAALVSYSRIYVGKHYLGDVLGGSLFGLAAGCLSICLLILIFKAIDSHALHHRQDN